MAVFEQSYFTGLILYVLLLCVRFRFTMNRRNTTVIAALCHGRCEVIDGDESQCNHADI